MKKLFRNIILISVAVFGAAACESYLDKSPDLGLDESAIYKNYESIRGFLDRAYLQADRWNMKSQMGLNANAHTWDNTDQAASMMSTNNWIVNNFNQGNWYSVTRQGNWEVGMVAGGSATIINKAYIAIRIANRVIAGIDKVQNITDEQKKEILGQAYFYRAWHYYQLITRYGGMPKLDRVFDAGEDDIPRMTYQESNEWMQGDIDKAIELLPDCWDDKNYGRPDKAAAMGLRSESILYAASPLFQNGLDETVKKPYDKDMLLEAAKASQDVLKYLVETETGHHFTQASAEDMTPYEGIFVIPTTTFYHEEYLWYDRRNMTSQEQANTLRNFWQWQDFDRNSGADAQCFTCINSETVKLYDRKGEDGIYYPVTDPRSGYKGVDAEGKNGPWSDFQNRDPRLYSTVLLPGQRWGTREGAPYYITSWEGGRAFKQVKSGELVKSRQFTGFLCRKYTWPEASRYYKVGAGNADNTGYDMFRVRSFYIRVTEMYLNYAEAVFEATGSATVVPSGLEMSAADAINAVRARVGLTPLAEEYTTAENFRQAYRKEREIELLFEGHHRWEDIRRWMIFDEVYGGSKNGYPFVNTIWTCTQGPNTDVDPSKYNDGKDLTFTYREEKNTIENRVFYQSNKFYLYPFPGAEVGSLSNLKQNPGW